MTVLFLGTLWYWMRYSRLEKGGMRRAGDLKVVGYGFIMLASWLMCGIVGPPGSAARPDGMKVESIVTSSYAVMLFLFSGFPFHLSRSTYDVQSESSLAGVKNLSGFGA